MLYQLSYRPIFWISGEKRDKRYQFPNRSASDIFFRFIPVSLICRSRKPMSTKKVLDKGEKQAFYTP